MDIPSIESMKMYCKYFKSFIYKNNKFINKLLYQKDLKICLKEFFDGSVNTELCIIAADGQEINYFDYSDNLGSSRKNNIYLGTVSRVEPSLQAAFIEFGSEKKAFLPFDEIHPSYFKIPHKEKIFENGSEKTNEIDEERDTKKNFLSFYRKYKIQDVIKKDQVLLIQIVKEEREQKEPL